MMRRVRAPVRSRCIGISELKFPRVLTVSLDASLASDPIVRVFRHQLMSGRSAARRAEGKPACGRAITKT